MNFLWLNIIFPPIVISFVSLKLLEFGDSNNFYLPFVQEYEGTLGPKKKGFEWRLSLL